MTLILRLFFFLNVFTITSIHAQFTDERDNMASDSIPAVNDYEKYNKILGGDSVRYCNNYPCKGWIRDDYPDGIMKHRGFYVDGRLESVYKNYYNNGQLEREFVLKNYKVSTMSIYYPDGQKLSEIEYFFTEPISWTDYYPDGKIEYAEEYHKSGQYVLLRDFYYESGQLQSSFRLFDKKKNLFEKIDYYPNGNIKEKGMMLYNRSLGDYQKTGIWYQYDENSKLLLQERYYKNKLVDDNAEDEE